jgi:phosphatidylserine/phosphatidylglycerophosphate/cardiolipin synthase-like enzyme
MGDAERTATAKKASTRRAKAPPEPQKAPDPAPAKADPKSEIGKIAVGAVRSLSLRLSVPMREGVHLIPTWHADARIAIRPDTQVEILARAVRGTDSELRLTTAELWFTNEITVLNPASALGPTGGFFGGAIDWIKDALADVRVRKVRTDADGQVHVDGEVVKPWPLAESPVENEIPEGTLPKFNLGIETMLFGDSAGSDASKSAAAEGDAAPAQTGKRKKSQEADPPPPADPAPSSGPTLEALLKSAGAMSDRGRITIDLETEPVPAARLGVAIKPFEVAWPARPVTVRLSGKAGIAEDGALQLTISRAASPSLGPLSISGVLTLRCPGGAWCGEGTLRPRLDLAGTKILFAPAPGVEVPMELLPKSEIGLEAHLTLEHGELALDRGGASLRVRAGLDSTLDPRFSWRRPHGMKLGGSSLLLPKGEVTLDARAKLAIQGKSIALDDGTASLRLVADDVDVRHRHIEARLGARIEAGVECEDLAIGADGSRKSGHGKATFALDPSGDKGAFTLRPIRRVASFSLAGGDKASIDPGSEGLSEILAPMLELTGYGEPIVNPRSPAAGPAASVALKARIAELTGAAVRKGNRVELLVDGVRSHPRRLDLIRSAKASICLQTLIFKDDEAGTATAAALVEAASRGVAVRVIVDALGNVERVVDLLEGKRVYRTLKDGGVRIELYNDPLAQALREIIKVLSAHPELAVGERMDDLKHLKDPARALGFFNQLFRIASGRIAAPEDARAEVTGALGLLFGAHKGKAEKLSIDDLAGLTADGVLSASELLLAARQVADLNHRWHEKYLVIDGRAAILGGMNIADEYLLGGTDRIIECVGVRRPAWRDTDVFIEGPAAADAYQSFADNWSTITAGKETLPPIAPTIETPGDVEVQVLQHRPYNDADHHVANFMLETLKALEKGQRAWIANAYFLPTGALRAYKQALIDAAGRGVDVRVLTNSATTSDLPQINEAAVFAYRELLEAGVRIWERTGLRTMHTKAAVFGSSTIAIGSWNADNRSESLNSEALAVVYSEPLAAELEAVLERDRDPAVAREILLAEMKSRPIKAEVESMLASLASDLM